MESELAEFAQFTEKDVSGTCPKVSLGIKLQDEQISTTLSSLVIFNLRRDDDPIEEPVSFNWRSQGDGVPWASFILLRHTPSGLQKVAVQSPSHHEPEYVSMQKAVGNRQLGPGEEDTFWLALADEFHKALAPGEKYTLYWPGAKIPIWQLGRLQDGQGVELKRNANQQNLVIPAGPHVTFEVQEEQQPWPERAGVEAEHGFREANYRESEWRWKNMLLPRIEPAPTPRSPGAPILNVKVEGPSEIPVQESYETLEFKLTVTYEESPIKDHKDRPIVLHIMIFTFQPKQLLRKTQMGWERMESEISPMLFVDDPDITVKVGEHEDFISLAPGESWSWTENVGTGDHSMLPTDVKVGDLFRYTFLEDKVDWWNWGGKEDHVTTEVKLPCFRHGPVMDPKDNDGRPGLIIPTSNSVEVRVVERV